MPQGGRLHAEATGGAARALDDPAAVPEHAGDVRRLDGAQRITTLHQWCCCRIHGRRRCRWQLRAHQGAGRHDGRPLDHIGEIANVARPRIAEKTLARFTAQFARAAGQEVPGEQQEASSRMSAPRSRSGGTRNGKTCRRSKRSARHARPQSAAAPLNIAAATIIRGSSYARDHVYPPAGIRIQAEVALAATDDATRNHALRQSCHAIDRTTRLVQQRLILARTDTGRAS